MGHLGCILLGAPGSGKGTQAKILHRHFKIPHISTGDILRSEIQKKSPLGLEVSEVLAAGKLVDDGLMEKLVRVRLSEKDIPAGYILDGYPRNVAQAGVFDKIIKDLKYPAPLAIYIELPESELIARITGRLSCPSCGSIFHELMNPPKVQMICDNCSATLTRRKDDTSETAKKRLEIYRSETEPLLEFYKSRSLLKTVSGLQQIDKITKDIQAILENTDSNKNVRSK